MAKLIDTVAWVHVVDGRVLGARSRGKSLFYVPGGKRHTGESDLQTLVREIEEELTVTLRPETIAHFGTYETLDPGLGDGVRVRMACYTGAYQGTLAPSSEIEELAWLAYEERSRTPAVDHLVFEDLKAAGLLV